MREAAGYVIPCCLALFGALGGGCGLILGLDEYSLNTCLDGVRTPGESDVDCGGPCAACEENAGCFTAADCTSGVCIGGACAAPSCSDGVKNGAETAVDCGGKCDACGSGGGGGGGAGGVGGTGGSGGGSQAICGDGIVTVPEKCDDTNLDDGDLCSSDCNCGTSDPNADAFANPDNGHCYLRFNYALIFFDAITQCAKYDTHLATVTTLKERAFVGALVSDTAWIGGTDTQSEGTWSWVKEVDPWTIYPCDSNQPGCDNNINLWEMGEPNDFSGNEDCLALYKDTHKFFDLSCDEEHLFLCERSP
jgi:hypothetical protein